MYPRIDAPHDFNYPPDGLLGLHNILTANEIRTPGHTTDYNGDPARIVIKHGLTTLTTIGHLTGFKSFTCHYYGISSADSLEVAVYPYDTKSFIPFSRGGDSGSIIVDARGHLVALLTGGTGPLLSEISDVTYGTAMHSLFSEVIISQFPGANLYFDGYN